MLASLFAADLRRAVLRGLPLFLLAFCAAAATLTAFSENGAWVCVWAGEGGTNAWGFYPPTYGDAGLLATGVPEGVSARAFALSAAAVAHTGLFPLASVVFLHRFYFEEVRSGGHLVSLARGVPRGRLFLSKLVVGSLLLQGAYVALTLFEVAWLLAPSGFVDAGSVLQCVLRRVPLNLAVNQSYILFCMAAYSWLPNGPSAAGFLVVATIAGLVAKVAIPTGFAPTHMGLWIQACGMSWSDISSSLALMAMLSCVPLYVVAYLGMRRI
ncbi:hypothetical protein HLV37_01730 [Eggerthellaceae bacterium zg-1084]|uniref:hypothetical protein n=1 Tax=Berryella wangjianweii TaxID=2734634 RepID=UPI00155764B6|nr:hypothetical protein [Berryella wangjianweii]NPD30601.1 hypothetical protein [Berryella wangjianweii]